MEAFAVTEPKPQKKRIVTINCVEDIKHELIISSIIQPKPSVHRHKILLESQITQKPNIVHVVERKKKKAVNDEPGQQIQIEQTSIEINNSEYQLVTKKKQTLHKDPSDLSDLNRTISYRERKPIFSHRTDRGISLFQKQGSTIYLSQTEEKNSESSQKYFLASSYRKSKKSGMPYAQTYRAKQRNQFVRKKEENLIELESFPTNESKTIQENNSFRRKKRIFQEGSGQRKMVEHSLERSKTRRRIFTQYKLRDRKNDQKQNFQRPRFIKLRPKGFKKVQRSSQLTSKQSQNQSIDVFYFQKMQPQMI